MLEPTPTHEVLNQPPPLVDYNLFAGDAALVEAVRREGASWAEERLRELGARVGSAQVVAWGVDANRNPPVLRTHDRYGRRIDEVDFHPSWHELMRVAIESGLHNLPWREPRPGAHVARAALCLVAWQNEFGHGCPISMTYSSVPSLRRQPELLAEWLPRLLPLTYDPSSRPAADKAGVLIGMAMTEKQGGSDVRANTTRAVPAAGGAGGPGGEYLLTGHKWFCSAPMSDAFLVLAQAPGGLSCFLMPRFAPDGSKNRVFIQRLKDKLGNRSNASSEIELGGAWARMVGPEGRGVATIIEMVNHTRLDCVLGSTALMRQALVQALHHARGRAAFGRPLAAQPLMQNVLADLALESEASTVLALRLARAYDGRDADAGEAAFGRIAAAVAKFWVCKRTAAQVAEALECLGGNGYVEESPMPRLYRESPLNSIWEGPGNVICLDLLRAIRREPAALAALLAELRAGRGGDRRLDAHIAALERDLALVAAATEPAEGEARRLVERLALGLQASLLVRHAPSCVADAFVASRLGRDWGVTFGTLPAGADFGGILARALPSG
jgi:putative acyl-CoA dehydrogenase